MILLSVWMQFSATKLTLHLFKLRRKLSQVKYSIPNATCEIQHTQNDQVKCYIPNGTRNMLIWLLLPGILMSGSSVLPFYWLSNWEVTEMFSVSTDAHYHRPIPQIDTWLYLASGVPLPSVFPRFSDQECPEITKHQQLLYPASVLLCYAEWQMTTTMFSGQGRSNCGRFCKH